MHPRGSTSAAGHAPKRPCPRCGREIPVLSLPTELVKWYGWQPWQLSPLF